jgi:hypothetical protein
MCCDALISLIGMLFVTTCFICFICIYLTMENALPMFAEVNEKGWVFHTGDQRMRTEKTMQKTIFITESTDGVGLETAGMRVSLGHNVLLHGRSTANVSSYPVHISHRRECAGPENRVSFEDPKQDHRNFSGMFENSPLRRIQ